MSPIGASRIFYTCTLAGRNYFNLPELMPLTRRTRSNYGRKTPAQRLGNWRQGAMSSKFSREYLVAMVVNLSFPNSIAKTAGPYSNVLPPTRSSRFRAHSLPMKATTLASAAWSKLFSRATQAAGIKIFATRRMPTVTEKTNIRFNRDARYMGKIDAATRMSSN